MKRVGAVVVVVLVLVLVAMYPMFDSLPIGVQLFVLQLQRNSGIWIHGNPPAKSRTRSRDQSDADGETNENTGLIIYGPHHSGTKFVSQLFTDSLCLRDINTDEFRGKRLPNFLSEHYAGRDQHVPWKHTICTRRNPFQEARHGGVLYVCLVRPLDEWLSAGYEKPHEMNKKTFETREEFLQHQQCLFSHRWHKKSHMLDLDTALRNPLEQRAARMGYMHNLMKSGANVVLLNLKYVQQYPQEVLRQVAAHFDIPSRNKTYEPVPYMTTRDSHKQYIGEAYDPSKQNCTSWEKLCTTVPGYEPAMEAFIDTLTIRLAPKSIRRIPRRIMQTWKTRTLTGSMLAAAQSWRDLNPNYEYVFCDDDDMESFMLSHFPQYMPIMRAIHSGAIKADLFRCAYLYVHGGVYADIEFVLNQPLDSFVPDAVDMVSALAMQKRNEPQHQVMITAPRNPIFLLTLQLGVYNVVHRQSLLATVSSPSHSKWPLMAGIAGPPVFDLAMRCYVDESGEADLLRHGRLPSSIWKEGLYNIGKDCVLYMYERLLDTQYTNKGMQIAHENSQVSAWERDRMDELPAVHSMTLAKHMSPVLLSEFSSASRRELYTDISSHHQCFQRETLAWRTVDTQMHNTYRGIAGLRRPDQKITYQIIQTFKTRHLHGELRCNAMKWMEKNPEYDYRFFDDKDIRTYARTANFASLDVNRAQFERALQTVDSGAGRADLFRLLIIFLEGGCYFDLDTTCVHPLRSYVKADALAVSGCGERNDLHQWALLYAPGHPFLREALRIAVTNVLDKTLSKPPRPNVFSSLTLSHEPSIAGMMTGPLCFDAAVRNCWKLPPAYTVPSVPTLPSNYSGRYIRNKVSVDLLRGNDMGGNVSFRFCSKRKWVRLLQEHSVTHHSNVARR